MPAVRAGRMQVRYVGQIVLDVGENVPLHDLLMINIEQNLTVGAVYSLDHSNGELVIVGKIQGVFYSNGKKKSGFFSQIFG